MIPVQEIILRMLLGALIGGIIGFEREIHGRAAGFRTQLIVCVAAVLIMIVSENYYHYMHNIDASLRIDPARISAGALVGIGFLGGGVIIKSGYSARGLTTAASIWIVSAIGLAIGGGLYIEGAVAGTITIAALVVLRLVEKKMKILRFNVIRVSTPIADESHEEDFESVMMKHKLDIYAVEYEKNHNTEELIYNYTVSTKHTISLKCIFDELRKLKCINNIKISK